MSFSFGAPHTAVGSGTFVIDKRLYLTEDEQRLVEEGHPEARWLWCTPGMHVPREQAQRYGLLAEPEPEAETPKARPRPANKARTRPEDK